MVANQVYLSDSDAFFSGTTKQVKLYTMNYRNSSINAITWHKQGLQTIKVDFQYLNIKRVANYSPIKLKPGMHTISVPKNDVILSTLGYFSFSNESYFEPFTARYVSLKNNSTWIKENIDCIQTSYNKTAEDSFGWTTIETTFDLSKLYIKDRKLSLAFNIPHLSKEEYKNKTVSVDWINISIKKPGLEF